MTNYNYREAVAQDVRRWIDDNADDLPEFEDSAEMADYLSDTLWCEDSVTGNASGSYTFCRATAREYALADLDTVREAFEEYDEKSRFADLFFDEEWETIDVITRCYVLGEAVWTVADERFSDCDA